MQTMTQNRINTILRKHELFLMGKKGGKRIDLKGADLRCLNLVYADLSYADLRMADMYMANLEGADLEGADLRNANLQIAEIESDAYYIAYSDGYETVITQNDMVKIEQ